MMKSRLKIDHFEKCIFKMFLSKSDRSFRAHQNIARDSPMVRNPYFETALIKLPASFLDESKFPRLTFYFTRVWMRQLIIPPHWIAATLNTCLPIL